VGGFTTNGFTVDIRRVWAYPGEDVKTEPGFCGSPLVVKRGTSSWIAGFHISSFEGAEGHAEELIATEIVAIIELIRAKCPLAVPVAPLDLGQGTGLTAELGPLHEKSMINGVQTLNCEILGSIVQLGGKKNFRNHEKSRVFASRFADDFDDLRQEALGDERFVAPKSNGIEVDGVWKQPYLNAIRQMETAQNSDPGALQEAFCDYLDGVEDLPGIETVRVLTEEEAIFGVSNTSIGPFDMTTSMGYPFFKPKSNFVDKTLLHLGDRSYLAEVVQSQFDWALATLNSGMAVIPIVSWTLKDEAIKESKNDARGQRVFNSLPFYFNVLLKMFFGPILAFMGMHKQYFECYAGMNLASSDATWFARWMTFFGEMLCIDGDMKWCDKGIDNVMMIWVGNVLLALANVLGYSEADKKKCALLYAGLVYHCVYIKGDLMLVVHANPSGSLLTVAINSIYLSGQYRVTWYKGLRELSAELRKQFTLCFRVYVHLATLGDDNLANVSPLASWFNFTLLERIFRENGKFLVPADKVDGMYKFKSFFKCSFLKRRFSWSVELRNYVAVLETVSLAKMLTTRVAGRASVKDQEAGVLASAALEFFLRGRVAYEGYTKRALAVCEKYDIGTWWSRTYDEHMNQYAADHFQTWIAE